jgi:hypothetical protein
VTPTSLPCAASGSRGCREPFREASLLRRP